MDFYILRIVLLVIIILFIIAIICCYYAKYRSKLKKAYYHNKNIKMKNNELKEVSVKNVITYVISHNYGRIDFDSYDYLAKKH